MNRVAFSPAAQADLEQIWDYTCDRWDADQAERYIRALQRAVERVADNPSIGRSCSTLPGNNWGTGRAGGFEVSLSKTPGSVLS